MRVITSGKPFIDIDALACCVSYDEYLKLQGFDSIVQINTNLNDSITKSVKDFGFKIPDSLSDLDLKNAEFVVMDISEPCWFDLRVIEDRVTEIFDHHFGFEKYWNDRLGEKSHIEPVGACATLVYEKIKSSGLESKLSSASTNLLYTAIISNTLNFKAQITCNRDRAAFESLSELTDLPSNWIDIYFEELGQGIRNNAKNAIVNDTKIQEINGVSFAIGQNELWNSKEFLIDNLEFIENYLRGECDNWFYTSPSISEGKNYIFTKVDDVKEILMRFLGVKFDGDLGETKELWMRKEIIRELQRDIQY